MAQLSEWLQLMLAEIARKQEEERLAAEEQRARVAQQQQQQPKAPSTQSG